MLSRDSETELRLDNGMLISFKGVDLKNEKKNKTVDEQILHESDCVCGRFCDGS